MPYEISLYTYVSGGFDKGDRENMLQLYPSVWGLSIVLRLSDALASPFEKRGDSKDLEKLQQSDVPLWYDRPHRDDFAWYPASERGMNDWQEISAAANAILIQRPTFLPEVVFGAPSDTYVSGLPSDKELASYHMASETAKDRLTAPKVRVNQEKTKISIMMNLFPLDPARKFELPVTFAMPSGEEKYVAWLAAITEAFHSPEVQAKLVKYPFASDPAPYQPEFKMNKTRDVLEMLIGLPIEYLTKYTAETDGAHCLPNNVETWFTTSVYQTSGQATCSGIITNRKPKLEDMLPWFQSSNGIPMVTYQPDTGIRPILYNAADQRYR